MKFTSEEQMRIVCENLKRLREFTCLGVEEMAKKLHISREELISIETGDMPDSVTVDILFRIINDFGIPVNYIFDKR